MLERFKHDICPKCGTASVPQEHVPDQALRGCPNCGHDWLEDLTKPPTEAAKADYAEAEKMVANLVDRAMNDIYKQIQDKIGVKTGDDASIYHSGKGVELETDLCDFFVKYVRFEKRMKETS